ncbi:hypothetical protein [Rufibacter hautae]|uniref:Uncharacterized protein n=1 Tax=Rufibacter hautae TaxID=2595005 RepID=A0A5B6TE98_9BACT|nr:hypothetical protein [Rufibacter hautae]KAA3437704.1 hypothetical protein FOA19_10390 [Rufibacter hautae]
MEKLIILYCLLIVALLGVLLVLLLFMTVNKPEDALSRHEKVLFACGGMIGLIILHLNWLLLPWSRQQKGDAVAFGTIILLTILLLAPIFFLLLPKQKVQDL